MSYKLTTTVLIEIDGAQIERKCVIEYERNKGFAGDRTDPPEADSVEVTGLSVAGDDGRLWNAHWLIGALTDDDDIRALLLADWAEEAVAAAEYRAEQRRDDAMMERQS